MLKVRSLIVLVSAFAWISVYGGGTDMYMKMKISQPDAKKKEDVEKMQETWVSPTKVRSNSGDQSSILDLEKNILISIDHTKKKYTEIPLNFTESLSSEDQQAVNELPGFMKNMMKMEVTVQPTNEEKHIGQWHCRKYLQTMKMTMISSESEIWASEEVRVNMDVYRKFSAAMMASQPGFYKMFQEMMKESEKIKGVTVFQKTISKAMGKTTETTTELIEVKETEVSPDLFTIPAGYKQEKFKEN